MELKLNQNYTLKDIAINYAKQNNLCTMMTYYVHQSGWDQIVEHVSFFVYENLEELCYKIIKECIVILRNEWSRNFEMPDYLTNDEIFIQIGSKTLVICNIQKDKINIRENDDKIREAIEKCLEFNEKEIEENEKYITDDKIREIIKQNLDIIK